MSCYWYDSDYKLSTCSCDLGDACRTCDCNGNVNECSLLEFGRPVAFEEGKIDGIHNLQWKFSLLCVKKQ